MCGLQQLQPLKLIIDQTALNMVTQLCYFLEALLPESALGFLLDAIFIECVYCSLGATLLEEGTL